MSEENTQMSSPSFSRPGPTRPGKGVGGGVRKRFYTRAGYRPVPGGYGIELDGRGVKTPAQKALVVPSGKMAEAVSGEWAAQGVSVDPASMTLTRLANTALDRVAVQRVLVEEEIAAFARSDLLCYRVQDPAELARRQAEAWQPLLDWAESRFGVRLETTNALMPVPQNEKAVETFRHILGTYGDFALAGLHGAVTLTGSLILALAMGERRLSPAKAHALAHIDESWQAEQWGEDEEEIARLNAKAQALQQTGRFLVLLDFPASSCERR